MSRIDYAVTAVDMAEHTPYSVCIAALVMSARRALDIEPGEELGDLDHERLCRALRTALNDVVALDERRAHPDPLFESDEDQAKLTLDELIEANQDCPIAEAKLLALTLCRAGDQVSFGGGATPRVTLTRIR